MYEAFYEFANTPFSRDIPTDQLYPSLMMEEVLGRLQHAAERQLFAVVTGDSGTGKTTTLRRLRDTLDPSKFMMMYLADSKLTPRHFYKGLLEQLGCKSKILQGRMLNRSCTEKTHAGYPPPAAHGAMLTRPTYWIEKCSKRFGPYLISRWMLRVLWS